MIYPFAALVGQEQLKTALLLNAVYPAIGGVLIRGEKGTAKSTAARALAALLPPLRVVRGCPFRCDPEAPWTGCPHCSVTTEREVSDIAAPFVDLPLGATEDRVLGTLDFERALREGCRAVQPGLLAAAHRGILYIDEVNLLADHLVDVLLDAAALGVNTVQREGIEMTHPARFLLIGTMNPEEGELRPQLLDRFGLMVEVTGPREPEVRAEVVRRRLTFEADPTGFETRWSAEQAALRSQIVAARELQPRVTLSDTLLSLISGLCCEFAVDGLRADIALHKTARALAALTERTAVTITDVQAAAQFVLPHRQRRRPFEQPQLDNGRLNETLDKLQQSSGHQPPPMSKDTEPALSPGAAEANAGTAETKTNRHEADSRIFEPIAPRPVRRFEVMPARGTPDAGRGRRNTAPGQQHGAYVRAVPDEQPGELAVDATVRAAALRGGWADGRLHVEAADLHRKEREGRTGTLLLFVVDASGSMAARRRMEMVKGAVLALLHSAYEQRDRVGVISFRGTQAEVLLPPTNSVELAERALRVLPTGGRTPLAHALALAGEVIRQARRNQPDLPVLLVLFSDGKANVPFSGMAGDPWAQATSTAAALAAEQISALVLDTDVGLVRAGRAEALAHALAAEYLLLEGLSAGQIVLQLRQRQAQPPLAAKQSQHGGAPRS